MTSLTKVNDPIEKKKKKASELFNASSTNLYLNARRRMTRHPDALKSHPASYEGCAEHRPNEQKIFIE